MKESPNHHGRGGNGLEEMVGAGDMANPTPFDVMEGEETMGVDDREIWLERSHEGLLNHANGSSIFYSDFPLLPDFPCMSSSSSSSSSSGTPAPAKPISSSSSAASSAASWAALKSDVEEDVERKYQPNQLDRRLDQVGARPPALSSTSSMEALPPPDESMGDVDCVDVMENLGYMDLIDANEIWDPSSIFQSDHQNPPEFNHEKKQAVTQQEHPRPFDHQNQNDQYILQGTNIDIREQRPLDELGVMFFEWLKTNKEYISADDMRKIKLRSATVESASKRLGSTKEGRKQLLKLILEWVERYQLQKKQRLREEIDSQFPTHQHQDVPFQNPNPSLSCNSIPFDANSNIFSHSPWMPSPPPHPYVVDPPPIMVAPPGFPQMAAGFLVDPYSSGGSIPPHQNQNINGQPSYPPPTEHIILDSYPCWGPSQYAMASQFGLFPENVNNSIPIPASIPPHPQPFPGYGCQYPYPFYQGNGERLVRLGSSATKEARKKRMARQRRLVSHHRHHNLHSHQNQQNHNQNADQQARLGSENCTVGGPSNPASWVYWANAATPASSTLPLMPTDSARTHSAADRLPVQAQNSQRTDKRQGWKTEKSLKFLLQKVLKQSDVGNLGRIVLPKKEAEAHLPELEARDGIAISLEDIGMSRVWNMRYRFWPNNKSRMYLLENTGDFVRANGLQEGDFIVIYSDIKCGKYLIRGVKVRQTGLKAETKKPVKSQRSLCAASPAAGNGSCSPLQLSQRLEDLGKKK